MVALIEIQVRPFFVFQVTGKVETAGFGIQTHMKFEREHIRELKFIVEVDGHIFKIESTGQNLKAYRKLTGILAAWVDGLSS